MTNQDRAAEVILKWVKKEYGYPEDNADSASQALEEARLLMPDNQVIRTQKELEELDPDTALIAPDGWMRLAGFMQGNPLLTNTYLPAAVLATGAQVRAAREAMEQIND